MNEDVASFPCTAPSVHFFIEEAALDKQPLFLRVDQISYEVNNFHFSIMGDHSAPMANRKQKEGAQRKCDLISHASAYQSNGGPTEFSLILIRSVPPASCI